MDIPAQRGFISEEVTSTVSFSWTINDFLPICENTKPMDFIRSPMFTSFGSKGNWYIKMYPDSLPDNKRQDVGSWISIVPEYTSDEGVEASMKVNICSISNTTTYDSYGQLVLKPTKTVIYSFTFTGTDHEKCDPFIKQSDVLKNLKDGLITITCELTEIIPYKSVNKLIQDSIRLEEFDDFEDLFQNEEHSDVTLLVGLEKFPAHKSILSRKSPVFAAMFKHDMLENNENIVEIKDVEPNVMKELLRFVYVGKVFDIEALSRDLYIAADKYSLNSLKNLCEDVICKTLSVSNVIEYLNFAISYGAKKLRNEVFDFMASNKETLKTNE